MDNNIKTLEDGLIAYKQQKYKEAAKIWTILADQGDAEAQFNIGVMFKNGIGVPQDDSEAMRWLRQSSAQDHEHAKLIVDVIDRESEDSVKNQS